jgi:hypothetical protein
VSKYATGQAVLFGKLRQCATACRVALERVIDDLFWPTDSPYGRSRPTGKKSPVWPIFGIVAGLQIVPVRVLEPWLPV